MPSRNILVINCGSSSIKFALVNEAHSLFPLHGLAERLGSRDAVLRWKRGGDSDSLMIPNADHRAALAQLLPMVQNAAGGKLHGIGHRVVHGGELFTHATRIDDRVVEAIRATAPLAPLHNPANLQGIEAAMTLFPKLPHVAVFDTAFHQSLPEYAYRYALPEALYREHGVRRYGFHGTSHRYVSHRAAEMAGLAVGDSSWLSAHLGNGSSTCAIVNGQSLDTSMGLTPLEQEREQGHPGAALAIEVFCYRLAKSLAAMSCALPQLDGVIFTGGIGENSPLVRAKTAAHLRLFDLRLDQEANARCVRGVAGPIQAAGHPRVLVIPTNEERQIALDTLALLD